MLTNEQLKEIYNEHHKLVYNLALNYLQSTEDAEEITQEVFLTVYQSYGKFYQRSSLKTWIYRITINKSIDFLKAKKRQKRFAKLRSIFNTDGKLSYEPVDFTHPGAILENKENTQSVFKAIEQLPETQKTVFLLSQTEDLGNKEIAELIGKNVGAVESLLQRAKENLKKILTHYYEDYRRNQK